MELKLSALEENQWQSKDFHRMGVGLGGVMGMFTGEMYWLNVLDLYKLCCQRSDVFLSTGQIQFNTLSLKFKDFLDENRKSKMMNLWRYYSTNLREICNIIGPET